MFRKNEQHRQKSFFSSEHLLPETLKEKLLGSWAETFYQEVLCQIDEEIFAPLYSEEASRPNVPVNVLVGAEILKSGFGWSDEELHEQVNFNLQVRHALGLHDLRGETFTLRTLYNFRRRVREYAEETGINLMQEMFEQVTDAQLERVAVETEWQRMDSTQVLSNLARMTRLELLVAVLQVVYRQLSESMQETWGERWALYLDGRPHQVGYKIPTAEVDDHLVTLGQELCAVEAHLADQAPESEALDLIRRVLEEQYECEEGGGVTLRPPGDVPSDSLQSPHDPEATYRVKGNKRYRGGYVANVSETADPENEVQLIVDVQVEPNNTDDGTLLATSLEGQAERETEVEQVTVDGGYTGPQADAACEDHSVDLRPTRLRGGKPSSEKWGYDAYEWGVDEEGQPVRVTCPEGQTAEVKPSRGEERYIARFPRAACEACPYFKGKCRVAPRRIKPPSLYVGRRDVQVARQRQQLRTEDKSIRAVVEATVRSLKRAFPGGKLPVRGLTRVRMMLFGAALMVNVRRLHRYFVEQGLTGRKEGASFVFRLLDAVFTYIWHIFSSIGLVFTSKPAAALISPIS